jgi:hypothetical protein
MPRPRLSCGSRTLGLGTPGLSSFAEEALGRDYLIREIGGTPDSAPSRAATILGLEGRGPSQPPAAADEGRSEPTLKPWSVARAACNSVASVNSSRRCSSEVARDAGLSQCQRSNLA